MNCKHCGAALPEDANFCGVCGNSQLAEAPAAISEAPAGSAEATVVSVETPIVPAESPVSTPEAAPEKPKRNVKRLVITLVAAVLALAVIGCGVAFAMDYFSPESKLERALDATGDALEQLFDGCTNLTTGLNNIADLAAGDTVGYTFTIGHNDLAGTPEEISMHVDASTKANRYSVDFLADFLEYPQPLMVNVYFDAEELVLGFPGIWSDSYRLPLKDLAEALTDSALGLAIDADTAEILESRTAALSDNATAALAESVEAILEDAVVEEVEHTIPGALKAEAVYSWTCSYSELFKLYLPTIRESLQAEVASGSMTESELQEAMMSLNLAVSMLDSNLGVYFGVTDGKVTAFELNVMGQSFVFLLDGVSNPWESFRLIVVGEEILSGNITATSTGASLNLNVDDSVVGLSFNDAACTGTITCDGEALFTFTYGCAAGGFQFNSEIAENYEIITIDFSMEPGSEITKPADAINLLDLSEDELEALADQVISVVG